VTDDRQTDGEMCRNTRNRNAAKAIPANNATAGSRDAADKLAAVFNQGSNDEDFIVQVSCPVGKL